MLSELFLIGDLKEEVGLIDLRETGPNAPLDVVRVDRSVLLRDRHCDL